MYITAAHMDYATRILIVDDDPDIRTLMSAFLQQHGYHVDAAEDALKMRDLMERGRYDLLVLDIMMPGEDGLSILRKMQRKDAPPVIMLSAIGTDIDRIIGLEIGAEDYMSKPCNPRELLARIRTVLRRRSATEPSPVQTPRAIPEHSEKALGFAGWKLDLVSRLLHDPEGVLINLSDSEFRLLKAFIDHPRRVLSRDQLLDYARGVDSEHYDRAIDVQISRLRRKLGASDDNNELIRTVRNEGYMFVPVVTQI
jgi:two-component system OmpR family response regulator